MIGCGAAPIGRLLPSNGAQPGQGQKAGQLPLQGNYNMPADKVFSDVKSFAAELRELHAKRRSKVIGDRTGRVRRTALTRAGRSELLRKTGGRCHICGGKIDGDDWEADHVLAHGTGGVHAVDNYLPAHSLCNNYRWHYDAEEFQWILKIGVWARTQIEKETTLGKKVGGQFCEYDKRRAGRRKPERDRIKMILPP
jgi:5-methylcytosine-specific restriction endonuclease McrA